VTTRNRPRPGGAKTYTARLYQRAAAPKRRRLVTRPLLTAVTLTAEIGHLTAALIEWPAAPVRGLVHVFAAAVLGLLTAIIYFGQSRVELMLGIVATLAVPGLWFAGAVFGLALYQDFPLLAAIAVSTVEFGAAGLLAASVSVGVRRRNGRAIRTGGSVPRR
jgi:hypothetical protein